VKVNTPRLGRLRGRGASGGAVIVSAPAAKWAESAAKLAVKWSGAAIGVEQNCAAVVDVTCCLSSVRP